MFITGFSPSIVRASIMQIVFLVSNIVYRKNDVITSISLSLLTILMYNPFLIKNLGVIFSYTATIGIILLNKNVKNILKNIKIKKKKWQYRINFKPLKAISKLQDILSISISAQLVIFPIMIYQSNIFNTYFLITNLLVSLIIVPLLIISFITILSSFIFIPVATIFSHILNILVSVLIGISNFSEIPFSKIYFSTSKVYIIVFYYILLFILNKIYSLYHKKQLSNTEIRARNIIALVKYKVYSNKSKIAKFIFIFLIILIIFKIFPKSLKIHFVDVNQGDCTFIVTPTKKTILIDGGGSNLEDFDVGKDTLLPYILDRGYTDIDYIMVSHMDQDHVGGLLTIMQEIKVRNVIISKQGENSENFQKLIKLVEEKRINLILVNKGERLKIEKDLYFDVLWPDSTNFITENALNNNSIVCKLYYKDFSMLFTGDIEETAEKQILKEYKNKLNILDSTILKVGHHGSKTSSTKEFIEEIKPKIALIGVGKSNKFGHPNDEVIERLENLRCKDIPNRSNGRNSTNNK